MTAAPARCVSIASLLEKEVAGNPAIKAAVDTIVTQLQINYGIVTFNQWDKWQSLNNVVSFLRSQASRPVISS